MTNLEALIGLNKACDIGTIRLQKLLDYFGNPENILKTPKEKLVSISGIGEGIAKEIRSLKKEDIDIEFSLAKKHNLKIISLDDKDYPENLKNIPDPPIVLYIKGTLKEEDKFSIAIVGSRRASFYGLSCAERFASDLSNCGFTIVSGMARGIDTYAHQGALKSGGRTIAVMGSGFHHIYPAENKELVDVIAKNGAIISEFPIEARPLKQNFPRRNRIISGISQGLLVVEAARNSGALITADFALEQGREVFALPGKVDARTSFGTNGLIKQGAKLVSCVEDILEEFNSSIPKHNSLPQAATDSNAPACIEKEMPDLSSEESLLYSLISTQSIGIDEIVEKTEFSIPKVTGVLLNLQMKKLIRQLPGKQFIKAGE